MGKHIKLSVISLFQPLFLPGDHPSLRVLQATDPNSEADVSVFSGHENTHPNSDCTSLALHMSTSRTETFSASQPA